MIPDGWRDGEVAVVGLARSGRGAARLLAARGLRVYASDAADTPAISSKEMPAVWSGRRKPA